MVKTPTDHQPQPFQAQATGEEKQSARSDIPIKQEGGVVYRGRPQETATELPKPDPLSPSPTSEERGNGQKSDMVTSGFSTKATNPPQTPVSPPHYRRMWTYPLDKIMLSLTQGKECMTSCLDEQMKEVEECKKRVEGYWSDKATRLENEADSLKTLLAEAQEKYDVVQKDLTEKRKKIESLEKHVSQKDKEPKEEEVTEDKEVTLKVLKQQLKEAHDEFEEEKNDIEDELEEALEKVRTLMAAVEKTNNDLKTIREEKEEILKCTGGEKGLVQLKCQLQYQKALTKAYRCATIFFGVLFFIMLLFQTTHLTNYTLLPLYEACMN